MKRNALIVLLALIAMSSIPALSFAAEQTQDAKVTITAKGFEPATLNLKANVPAKITFLRTTNDTCATEVVFPDYKVKKDIPLNKPVVVEFTPKKGSFGFACGANMVKGKLVVE